MSTIDRAEVKKAVEQWVKRKASGYWEDYWTDHAVEQVCGGKLTEPWPDDAEEFLNGLIAHFRKPKPIEPPVAPSPAAPRQSREKARFDLLPPLALRGVAETLSHGAEKYGAMGGDGVTTSEPNWSRIPIPSHLDHAMSHLNKYFAADPSEDHLAHAATRLMFALELHRRTAKENG